MGGRFRLKAVAYRSGATTVYQATDARNQGSTVAVKEVHVAGMSAEDRAEVLAWLAREAALLSTLRDPRLPRLLAAFGEGDRHYVVMPFLRGETLEQRIAREGPQPELQVLEWGRELAELLHYLHTQDPPIIHRDLKPANVLLRADGGVTLLDLGVARPLAGTTPGTAVGTPGYAPPEQYHGLADERSDLYALGATLHRALTGYDAEHEQPFRHPPVHDLNPGVSEQTASLLTGLLQVAPQRRPPRAHAALAFLRVAARGAFRETYGPLQTMYRQLLVLLIVTPMLGALIYHWCFGAPPIAGRFKPFDPVLDPLRVLLIFAPGLLLFLPFLRPRLRDLARQRPMIRSQYLKAAALIGLPWVLALVSWLRSLYTGRWGDLVAVPGLHSTAALQIPLSLACATVGLVMRWRDIRQPHGRAHRRWLPVLLLAYFILIWFLLLVLPVRNLPAYPAPA